MTISKSMKFSAVRSFAKVVISEAGKGQTIAALVVDFNTTAMMHGFDFLMINKPGRVAKLIEAMEHVISRLDAMPEFAERVPDVTPEKRAEHLEHAEHLRGIFRSHGIDPQDFDACLDYIIGNGNIVPRYWAKIYVDYIYQVTPFCPDEGCPHSDIVHYCNVMPGATPEMADDEVLAFENWHPINTEQEARAVLTRGVNLYKGSKSNKFPRGNCAKRMLGLGWEFNY